MEFVGSIKEIGKVKDVNGTQYREIVFSQVNYNSGYETNIVFTFKNEKTQFNGQKDYALKQLYTDKVLTNGNILRVKFNINAKQTQDGKWFNSVTAWGVETLDYNRNHAGNSAPFDNATTAPVQNAPQQPETVQNQSIEEPPF